MIAETSLEAFHGVVQSKKQRQYDLILSAMEPGKDYSFVELYDLTGILPSTCSARINELRDDLHVVVRSAKRQCSQTGHTVIPHKIKAEALVEA